MTSIIEFKELSDNVKYCITLDELSKMWKRAHRVDPGYDGTANNFPANAPIMYSKFAIRIPRDNYVPDGIVVHPNDSYKYWSSSRHIVFVLKEANLHSDSGGKNNDIFWFRDNSVPNNSGYAPRLRQVAEIIEDGKQNNEDWFRNVAYINLNKRGGDYATHFPSLRWYTWNYREFLRRQLLLLEADVIVCCGNGVLELIEKHILNDCRPYQRKKTCKIQLERLENRPVDLFVCCHPSFGGNSRFIQSIRRVPAKALIDTSFL